MLSCLLRGQHFFYTLLSAGGAEIKTGTEVVKNRKRLFVAFIVSIVLHTVLFCLPAADIVSGDGVNRSIHIQLIKDVALDSIDPIESGGGTHEALKGASSEVTPEKSVKDIESLYESEFLSVEVAVEDAVFTEDVASIYEKVVVESQGEALLRVASATEGESGISIPLQESTDSAVQGSDGAFGGDDLGSVSSGPLMTYQVEPVYSLRARRRGLEGVCLFNLTIGVDGRVEFIVLISSSGYDELDNSARKALEQSRFSPAVENGIPVRSEFEYTVRFQLND